MKRAEKWRNQVIREIAKKVTQIQNAGLGEFKLRDLNDEINKLLKEKSSWEDRIVELNGPDYKKIGPKLLDKEGKEVPGGKGYKYFGAAKDLPGVKELFDTEIVSGTKKSRAELMREIDADYYGYLNDEEYLLLPQELKVEQEARKRNLEEFYKNKSNEVVLKAVGDDGDEDEEEDGEEMENLELEKVDRFMQDDYDELTATTHTTTTTKTTAKKLMLKKQQKNASIPSLKEIEQAILEKKKKELLSKYVSDEQVEKEAETKILSGKI